MRLWKRMRLPYTSRDISMMVFGALIVIGYISLISVTHSLKRPLSPESKTITVPWIPASVKRWQSPIDAMASRYSIDPNLIAIIITMESGGYSKADSGYAQGLMQITPSTAKDIAARYVKKPVTNYDIWDPNTNIEFGAAYLAELRDIYGTPTQGPSWNSTVELVAASYNGGFGAANSLLQGNGLHDTQTVIYSRDAFNMWRERQASDSPTFDRWKERGGSSLLDQASNEIPQKVIR